MNIAFGRFLGIGVIFIGASFSYEPLWAAETAVLINQGSGSAPISAPVVVVDQRPLVVVDPSVAPVLSSPEKTIVIDTTTPTRSAPSTLVIDQSAPTTVERSLSASSAGVVTKTTTTTPTTTTIIHADGSTNTQTNIEKTTTIVQKPLKKLSTSHWAYHSIYRDDPRYVWNGQRWIKRS